MDAQSARGGAAGAAVAEACSTPRAGEEVGAGRRAEERAGPFSPGRAGPGRAAEATPRGLQLERDRVFMLWRGVGVDCGAGRRAKGEGGKCRQNQRREIREVWLLLCSSAIFYLYRDNTPL